MAQASSEKWGKQKSQFQGWTVTKQVAALTHTLLIPLTFYSFGSHTYHPSVTMCVSSGHATHRG